MENDVTNRYVNLVQVLAVDGKSQREKLEFLCQQWGVEPRLTSIGIMHQAKTLQRLAQHAIEYTRAQADGETR